MRSCSPTRILTTPDICPLLARTAGAARSMPPREPHDWPRSSSPTARICQEEEAEHANEPRLEQTPAGAAALRRAKTRRGALRLLQVAPVRRVGRARPGGCSWCSAGPATSWARRGHSCDRRTLEAAARVLTSGDLGRPDHPLLLPPSHGLTSTCCSSSRPTVTGGMRQPCARAVRRDDPPHRASRRHRC